MTPFNDHALLCSDVTFALLAPLHFSIIFPMETITVTKTPDRALIYDELIPQIRALINGERDSIAAMANVAAAIHQTFGGSGSVFTVCKVLNLCWDLSKVL